MILINLALFVLDLIAIAGIALFVVPVFMAAATLAAVKEQLAGTWVLPAVSFSIAGMALRALVPAPDATVPFESAVEVFGP
jgi:hypothetical protein